jgi:hypothetical protein
MVPFYIAKTLVFFYIVKAFVFFYMAKALSRLIRTQMRPQLAPRAARDFGVVWVWRDDHWYDAVERAYEGTATGSAPPYGF